MNHEKLAVQRAELAKTPELWQFNLLTPQEFGQFAKDRKISVFDADTAVNLWRAGLLRADLVTARCYLQDPSLTLVSIDSGIFTYCDERPIEHREGGYGGVFAKAAAKFDGLELWFHPFRSHLSGRFQNKNIWLSTG